MSDITSKDIESFGRVLQLIGQLCMDNPKQVLSLLFHADSVDTGPPQRKQTGKPGQKSDPQDLTASHLTDVAELNIFAIAKDMERAPLLTFLRRFDTEQLRFLIRRYRFGALKSKSADDMAEHIADQVLKRRVDVFKMHDGDNSGTVIEEAPGMMPEKEQAHRIEEDRGAASPSEGRVGEVNEEI
jgi:hypothetical protein